MRLTSWHDCIRKRSSWRREIHVWLDCLVCRRPRVWKRHTSHLGLSLHTHITERGNLLPSHTTAILSNLTGPIYEIFRRTFIIFTDRLFDLVWPRRLRTNVFFVHRSRRRFFFFFSCSILRRQGQKNKRTNLKSSPRFHVLNISRVSPSSFACSFACSFRYASLSLVSLVLGQTAVPGCRRDGSACEDESAALSTVSTCRAKRFFTLAGQISMSVSPGPGTGTVCAGSGNLLIDPSKVYLLPTSKKSAIV